jgi:hypothetical protein
MGWLDAIGSMFSWAEGSGVLGSLVRVAAAFGLMRFISGITNTNNNASTVVDNRIQVQPATDNKISVAYGASYFGGTIFDIELTNSNKSLWAAIALCETTGNLYSTGAASQIYIDAIYLDNKLITFASDGTTVDHTTDDVGVIDYRAQNDLGIYLYRGNSSNPMLPVTPGTTTAIAGTVPPAAYSIMPGWNNTYMAENLIFAIVKLNYDQSKGINTIPNLKFHVVNTMSLPGDVLYDYMTNDLYGANISPSLINTSSIQALNTYSSQSVTYGTYPAQQRYAINGLISTTNKVLDNMDKIASTAGSYITYDVASGKWSVLIQQAISQTFSFSDYNILGQVNATGTALDSYYNSVEVQFPYSYYRDQNNYIRIDLPTADLDYNEPINVLKLQHDLINNQVQAAIIGNIILRQSREDLAVEFKTDFSSYNLQIGDVFGLTNATYGFTNRQFRVIKLIKNEDDRGELTITVTGLSYNPDVYTVDTINQFQPLLGTSSNPNLAAIQTPIAPSVASSTISSQPSISITATVPSGVVTDMEFWASSDGTNYVFQGSTRSANSGPFASGTATTFKTVELQTATWYFKVRAGNQQGTSKFSPASTGLAYTYIQAPDVLPYNASVVDSSGNSLLSGTGAKLALGALAFYVAGKINWGDIASKTADQLASLFGISPDTVASVKSAVNSTFNGSVKAGTGINVSNDGTVSLDPSYVNNQTPATCNLTYGTFFPGDLSTYNPITPVTNATSDRAPHDGNYYFTITGSYTNAAYTVGTGSAKIYKSDGTLVKSISGSSITITNGNQVNLAFGSIDINTDYYIILDKNVVTDGTCQSNAINDPYSWNFHTADPQDAVVPTPPVVYTHRICPAVKITGLRTYLYSYYKINPAGYKPGTYTGQVKLSPDNKRVDPESDIGIVFNQAVNTTGTGTITINSSSGVFQTFDLSKNFNTDKTADSNLYWTNSEFLSKNPPTYDNGILWLNPTKDMTAGTTYWITMTSNCVINSCNTGGNAQVADSTTLTWTVDNGTNFKL